MREGNGTSASVVAENFLKNLFGPVEWRRAHLCVVPGDPAQADGWGGWAGGPAEKLLDRVSWETNNYFTVSLFQGQRRRETEFQKLMCLAIDDVGPKIDADLTELLLGPPTWRVETSQGNFQWGYKLAQPITDAAQAKALIHRVRVALTGAGAPDPGQEGVTRYMRLPCGSNLKTSLGPGGWHIKNFFWSMSEKLIPPGRLESLLQKTVVPLSRGQGNSLTDASILGGTGTSGTAEQPEPSLPNSSFDPDDDALYRAFEKLGRVLGGPRDTAMGWGFDVRCPWSDEHTDRAESGTVYVAGAGKFKCHHGHCLDRTVEDVREKLDELLRDEGTSLIDDEFDELVLDEVPAPPQGIGDKGVTGQKPGSVSRDFFERYVLLLGRNKFYDLSAESETTAQDIDSEWMMKLWQALPRTKGAKGKEVVVPPSKWLVTDRRCRRVGRFIGWPGKPKVFATDPDKPGRLFLNTWSPLKRPLKDAAEVEVDRAAVAPWLDVFWHVVGWDNATEWETGERVLDWMAMLMGSPDLKAGWQVVIIGAQGIGKDTIVLPLSQTLGADQARVISSQQFGSEFNEWAGGRLVQVSETRQNTRGTMTAHDQMSVLKAVFDNTREWIVVNPKFMPKYQARNVVMGWFTSNEREPLRLETGDRRFLVLDRSDIAPLSPGQYETLHRWLVSSSGGRAGGVGARGIDRVAEFLFRRWDNMDEDRRAVLLGNAPSTSAKQELLLRLGDPIEEWMSWAIGLPGTNPLAFPDVVTVRSISSRLFTAIRTGGEGLPSGVVVPNLQRLAGLLKKAGARMLNDGRQVRVAGAQSVLWAVRNYEAYKTLSPAQLAQLFINAVASTNNVPLN